MIYPDFIWFILILSHLSWFYQIYAGHIWSVPFLHSLPQFIWFILSAQCTSSEFHLFQGNPIQQCCLIPNVRLTCSCSLTHSLPLLWPCLSDMLPEGWKHHVLDYYHANIQWSHSLPCNSMFKTCTWCCPFVTHTHCVTSSISALMVDLDTAYNEIVPEHCAYWDPAPHLSASQSLPVPSPWWLVPIPLQMCCQIHSWSASLFCSFFPTSQLFHPLPGFLVGGQESE